MKKSVFKDVAITVLILITAFFISVLFQEVFEIDEHVSTLFAFAVFLISLFTKGYIYGIVSAIVGTLAINYAFTFPYLAFNFTIPVNLISAIVMVTIALLTGALTTKVKHQEQIKAESEKERMRANLLRAVSHDIRTPLTTIYGSASALIENKSELSDDQKEQMLTGIKQDSDWLVRMVENLLSVTRIDSGRVKIIKTPTAIDELVDSVLVKFRKRYPNQPITVSIPEDIIIVPMDAMLIEQVIVNLLENSVLHAECYTQIGFNVCKQEKSVLFEIYDDGCGIDEEKVRACFDGAYNVGDGVADGKKKHAGIGLSVCSTIVKAHGGSIFAENRAKNGARFCFTLSTEEKENEQQV